MSDQPIVVELLERDTPRGKLRVQLVVRPGPAIELMVDAMERAGLTEWALYGSVVALRAQIEESGHGG